MLSCREVSEAKPDLEETISQEYSNDETGAAAHVTTTASNPDSDPTTLTRARETGRQLVEARSVQTYPTLNPHFIEI